MASVVKFFQAVWCFILCWYLDIDCIVAASDREILLTNAVLRCFVHSYIQLSVQFSCKLQNIFTWNRLYVVLWYNTTSLLLCDTRGDGTRSTKLNGLRITTVNVEWVFACFCLYVSVCLCVCMCQHSTHMWCWANSNNRCQLKHVNEIKSDENYEFLNSQNVSKEVYEYTFKFTLECFIVLSWKFRWPNVIISHII